VGLPVPYGKPCGSKGATVKYIFLLAVGAAAGYVMGTKAGRERYEQIAATSQRLYKESGLEARKGELAGKAAAKASELKDVAAVKASDVAHQGAAKFSEATSSVKEKVTHSSSTTAPPMTDGANAGTYGS
jgi:hypothetical protein